MGKSDNRQPEADGKNPLPLHLLPRPILNDAHARTEDEVVQEASAEAAQ